MARPELLTRKEAAEYLQLEPQTLAVWACKGRYGLPFFKIGRSCRYLKADLDAFLAARRVTSTNEGANGLPEANGVTR
jgi:excisionase family DNA binding protein